MSWVDNIFAPNIKRYDRTSSGVPEGWWSNGPSCSATVDATDVQLNR